MASDLVEFKLNGVDGVLDMLKSLPAEVVSKRGGVVKIALRKGARVILQAEKVALQRSINAGVSEEESTGLLMKSLVVTRGKPPIGGKGERYLTRVKLKAYDGQSLKKKQKRGKRVTTLKTAQLMEYGSGHQEAQPWIRPAFKAKAAEAIAVVERETVAGIEQAVKKLLKT